MLNRIKDLWSILSYLDVATIKMVYRTFLQPQVVKNPLSLMRIFLFYWALANSNISNVQKKRNSLLNTSAYFFVLGQEQYLFADYKSAITSLLSFIDKFPSHVESYYLLSKAHIKLGNYKMALDTLYKVLILSSRRKTWLYLAQAIQTTEDFENFDRVFKQNSFDKISSVELFSYYIEAAARTSNYNNAIDMLDFAIKLVEKKQWKKQKTKVKFKTKLAEKALLDLKRILDSASIPFFLVSGTLLGCIRNGGILPHDKDLDVGVWDDVSVDSLLMCISESGCFEISPTRVKEQVKLKHINGTFIDIFYHINEDEYVWHATAKLRWINSPFTLVKYQFLNQDFLIPSDFDKYLTENYGADWRTPKVKFDSTFDTPNAQVLNENEMKLYLHKKLFECTLYGLYDEKQHYSKQMK